MKDLRFDIDSIKCFLTTEKYYKKKALKKTSDANMKRYTESANNNLSSYRDFVVNYEKETLFLYSKLRGITIVLTDILFKMSHGTNGLDDANKDWHYVFDLIKKADEDYKMENSEDIRPIEYIHLVEKYHNAIVDENNMKNMILNKQEAKRQAKESCRFKYKIGEKYALRRKTIKGDEISEEAYQVKKVVYSIGPNIVNSVVMKQIAGKPCQRKTLSPFDCQTFHLKYEPELFVFSMNCRFYKLSDDWTPPATEEKIIELIDDISKECKQAESNTLHIQKVIEEKYYIRKAEIEDEYYEKYQHCSSEEEHRVIKQDRDYQLDMLKYDIDKKLSKLKDYNIGMIV